MECCESNKSLEKPGNLAENPLKTPVKIFYVAVDHPVSNL